MNEQQKQAIKGLADEARALLANTTLFDEPLDVNDIDQVLAAFMCAMVQHSQEVGKYVLHLEKAE